MYREIDIQDLGQFLDGTFEMGGQVTLQLPTLTDTGLGLGFPMSIHVGRRLRIDTGAELEVLFSNPTVTSLDAPLAFTWNVGRSGFMGLRTGLYVWDMDAMIARIGFVGEMCYEIHVPASLGPALHEAIEQAGEALGIKPFGLEAQSVLRLEKGHVIIVVDTDNHTTLHEIGMGKIWANRKTDAETVGAPALRFAEKQIHREKLVGFMMEDPHETPPDGSVVVAEGAVRGRVCTSRYSPTLKASIGMTLVEPQLAPVGGVLEIYQDARLVKGEVPRKKTLKAKVVPMPFYDPKGERLRR